MDISKIKENIKEKYEIRDKIGEGAYSIVYKAKDKETNEIKAIKIMHLENIDDDDEENKKKEQDLIINELNGMKICSNDNNNIYSVKLYEFLWYENDIIIVMELCDKNLSKALKEKKEGFKPGEIYKIMKQLNKTFKIMVENNIVHRDLKLENILVKYEDKEQNKFTVKLTDYGMSRQVNKTKIFKTHVGTPVTMAPEILEGSEKYDNKCDLWSIGVIIYQLIFNEFPYIGETEVSLLNKIKNYKQKKLKKTENKYLDDLIRKLLVYNPKERIEWSSYFAHPFFDFSKWVEKTINCKVILVGESGVGKTSIISRYINNSFEYETFSTHGNAIFKKQLAMEEENKLIKFIILDTAGQEKYRSVTENFFIDSDIIILVYDITKKDTFQELKNYWIKKIREILQENISK